MVLSCRDTAPTQPGQEEKGGRDGEACSAPPVFPPDPFEFLRGSTGEAVTASVFHDFHHFPLGNAQKQNLNPPKKKEEKRERENHFQPVLTFYPNNSLSLQVRVPAVHGFFFHTTRFFSFP